MERTWTRVSLALALLLALPLGADAARGGPDSFGYTWKDQDEPTQPPMAVPPWTQNDLRAQGFTGDDAIIRLTIPAFNYYGNTYTQMWLSSNGWISFVDPATLPIPSAPTPPGTWPDASASLPNGVLAFVWGDWTLEGNQPWANAGNNLAGDGYTVSVTLYRKDNPATRITAYVTLWRLTSQIQYYYYEDTAAFVNGQTMIGVENATGTVGLPYMVSGVAQGGASFRPSYGVMFYPRGNLNCTTGVTDVTCNSAGTYSNNTGTNNVNVYNCSAGTWAANEKVFRLVLSRMSHLTINVSNTGGRNMQPFFVRSTCSEVSGCMVGGTPTLAPRYVAPGTYYIVVDGATSNDRGNFDLSVQCQDSSTLASCNTTLVGEATSGPDGINNWGCAAGMLGPERVYEVNVTGGPLTLRASLSNESDPNLTAFISGPSFDPTSPSCLVYNTATASAYDLPDGRYFVSVDAPSGTGGTYDLQISCARNLRCPNPANVIDVSNPTPVSGNTTGKPNNNSAYYCTSSAFGAPGEVTNFTGGEDVYEFTMSAPGFVSFLLDTTVPDLRLLILRDCYEGSCLMEGACGENLPAGTYRLVVDGLNGAVGPYAITPYSIPLANYNKWTQCPECVGGGCGQPPDTVRSTRWSFNSNNYCGTGCDFALFAVVECGTFFHTPFSDVETGHMRVYDVFQGRYLDLTARNNVGGACDVNQTGTMVTWEDSGCVSIPCPAGGTACGGGGDCRTNNRIMDVSFAGQPNVCGVYKLEFINWGGWAWQAFANCTGTGQEQFYLYSDLCSAISNYKPKPEVGIETNGIVVDNSRCAQNIAQGTITLENIGCLPAASFEIVIEQAPPAPPNPQVITVDLAAGARGTFPWTYSFTQLPLNLVFTVDGNQRVAECSEGIGSTVSCGTVNQLVRTETVPSCPAVCLTQADAGQPAEICEGAGLALDGAGSVFTCVAGVRQYRWEDGLGNPIPGCDWGPSAVCNVPPGTLPPGLNILTLRTRCFGDNPACETSAQTVVDVVPNLRPPSLGNTLRGYRDRTAARWSWAAILSSPVSAYRLYKTGDKRLASGLTMLDQTPPTATTSADESALAFPPFPVGFYQVVGVSCLGDLEGPF